MLSTLPIRNLTHGVFWRNFAADQAAADSPLGEWAYMSPATPAGLSRTELRNTLPHIQRQTVRFWFLLNLRPYDLSGGPWFSFASQNAGFGNSYFAPKAVSASEAIDREFGDLLSPDTGEEIASELPGQWMWNAPPPQFPLHDEVNRDLLLADVLTRLGAIEERLSALVSAEYGIGHNSGGETPPVSDDDAQLARDVIAATRARVEQADDDRSILEAWEPIKPVLAKLGAWLAAKADDLVTEAVKSLGKRAGDIVFWYAVLSTFQHGNAITELLKLLPG